MVLCIAKSIAKVTIITLVLVVTVTMVTIVDGDVDWGAVVMVWMVVTSSRISTTIATSMTLILATPVVSRVVSGVISMTENMEMRKITFLNTYIFNVYNTIVIML